MVDEIPKVMEVSGPRYENKSVVAIVPTRGMVHCLAAQSWANLQWPMNHPRSGPHFIMGLEVDAAYEGAFEQIVSKSSYEYILTMEDDVAVPPTTLLKLMDALREGGYDGISALYTRKEKNGLPHVYGDPTVMGDLSVLDVDEAARNGDVVECNAIPMGFSLYRRKMFEDIERPWFKNIQDTIDGRNTRISQDIYFCCSAREAGKRFAVHCGAHVGHINVKTDLIYMPLGKILDPYGKNVDGEAQEVA